MAQRIPLSREAVEIAETLHDVWVDVTADGVVETHEIHRVTTLIVDVTQMASMVDAAQAHAVAAMRRGPDSRNAQDRAADLIILSDYVMDREDTSMARKVVIDLEAEERRRQSVANKAAAMGMTVDQYADFLMGVVVEAVLAKRVEGKAILAAREQANAA